MDSQERLRLLVQRMWQLAMLLGVAFTAILVGYWYTQIVRGAYYRELAENNRLRELKVEAPRGVILDREGRPLVENVPSYFLLFDRGRGASLSDPRLGRGGLESSLSFLARTLERPQEEFARIVAASTDSASYVPLVMAEDLTLDQVARMEAASLEHPEFEIEVRQRRFYRHGTQTAHVVGYLGEASERALDRRPELHPGDLVGVKGVEQTYDSILRGTDGRRVVVVDSRGKFVHEELRQPSHPGGNLELTLDLELQQEAERFFADKVGSAVALDPRNGEILAMVSAPSFNPNVFARRIEHSDWRAIVEAAHQPLQNRAMQNAYPPGSVFKIVTAIAALEQGTVDPNDAVSCSGATRVFNHRFRCWKRGGHGRVDLRRAIAQSCDVYFYHLGARLTIDPIASWSKRLGLGEVTGIDLIGEKAGLVPDREWSLRQRGTMWFPGETVSVSIGQGPLLVTPLQVAVMMATVANGGHVVQPHLSRSLAPPPARDAGVSVATLDFVKDALAAVVNEGGTGGRARLATIRVAGKTGTAQVINQETHVDSARLEYERRDHAWFASFAPVEDPRLVVVVFVEHGGHGSDAAAPLAKLLYERYLGSLPVPRDT
ncbi:MAG TPA: penicillin-binding protein 2 [Thermoanaerobaculia bacterium]|nr:penicillin-binding protein 2 [Thermoanaerobaculia bacterium]